MRKLLKITFKLVLGLIVVGIIVGAVFLSTFDINKFKSQIIAEANNATGGELIINGDMVLKLSLYPYFEINNVAFRNLDFPTTQDLVQVKKASVSVSVLPLLYKTISIKEIMLEEPNVHLVKNKLGQSNWEFKKLTAGNAATTGPAAQSKSSASGYAIDIGKVSGTGIKVSYIDEVTDAFHNLNIKSISIAPKSGKNEISVNADYNNIPIAVAGTTSMLSDIIGSNKIDLDIAMKVVDARIGISGTADVDFKNFDFVLKGHADEMANAPAAFGVMLPMMGEMNIDGRFAGSSEKIKLAISELTVGKSSLTGDVNVVLSPRLKVDFKLHSPRIDTTAFVSAVKSDEKSSAQSQTSSSSAKLFSSEKLPLELLDIGTIKGVVSVDNLIWGKKDMPISTAVQTSVDLEASQLTAAIKSQTGESQSSASFIFGKQNPTLAKMQVAAKVEIPTVAVFLPKDYNVKGMPVKMDIKGQAYGTSMAELMAKLYGNVFLSIEKGTIDKGIISVLGGDLLYNSISKLFPNSTKNEEVEFTCGAANIDITDGQLNLNKTFAIQTEKFNVISGGDVNLDNETLEVKFDVTSTEGLQLGVSDILSSLLEIKGTLANPQVGMGAGQLVGAAVKTGVALLTGGLSLAGEQAYDMTTSDPNPCKTAWNKGVGAPVQKTVTDKTVKQTQVIKDAGREALKTGAEAVKETFKGIGNLFK